MIPINNYRQFIAELKAVAETMAGVEVSHVRLAVTESQLTNMLKDLSGVVLAGNIPSADYRSNPGYWMSDGECLLMVLEKMPRDEQGLESEYERYARLQRLMMDIVGILQNADGFDRFCDLGTIDQSRGLRVEWEYNEWGGFNGLSLTFRLMDRG